MATLGYEDQRGRLTTAAEIAAFILAGNATFTLLSEKTGARYTFKLSEPEEKRDARPVHFLSVMYGSDNEADFAFIGTLFDRGAEYRHSRKSNIAEGDVRERAFLWFLGNVRAGRVPAETQFWHEGRCCRCGRKLTVPTSVERGIGPECSGKMMAEAA